MSSEPSTQVGADLDSDVVLIPFNGLGPCPIDKVQLCEMGSSDAEGAYRAVSELRIWPDLMTGVESVTDGIDRLQVS